MESLQISIMEAIQVAITISMIGTVLSAPDLWLSNQAATLLSGLVIMLMSQLSVLMELISLFVSIISTEVQKYKERMKKIEENSQKERPQ